MFLQLEAMQNCEGEFVHINVQGILLVGKEDPLLIQFLPGPQKRETGNVGKNGVKGMN